MSKEKKRIDRLQRRVNHLCERIAEADSGGRDLTFDKAELSALLWAIPRLQQAIDIEREEEKLPPSWMSWPASLVTAQFETTLRDLRRYAATIKDADDRELVQHAADMLEVAMRAAIEEDA